MKEEEIDIIELIRALWSKKWFILKITGIFFILGIVIAFTSPKEYKVSSILIPEATEGDSRLGGSLGGLASLAGVNLGGLSGAPEGINPALYQSVSQSSPFLLELMEQQYFFSELGTDISIYDYYLEHYKTGVFAKILSVPKKLLSFIKGSNEIELLDVNSHGVTSLTKEELSIIENLRSRVFVEMDWDLNIVRIEVEMQDPLVAAKMALFTEEYITRYVSNYAVSKSKQQLESIENQYNERKLEFEKIQSKLALFRDQNKNVMSAKVKSEEEKLLSEYNLAFNIYNNLSQQREAVKLQIQENTPVFSILEPVKVPVENSSPNKAMILLLSILIGMALSLFFILTREVLSKIDL